MKLALDNIICGCCGKKHPTHGFKLVGNFGDCKFEKDTVYLHDTGTWEVNCGCGYRTTTELSFRGGK